MQRTRMSRLHPALRGVAVALLAAALAGAAWAQSPFSDVAPCHWATESVAQIAGQPQVDVEQARTSTYLAANAVRQVFEGLACGDLAWSAKFLADVPPDVGPNATLVSFTLTEGAVRLAGDDGTVEFTVVTRFADGEATRSGAAALIFDGRGWRVRYASLASLDLPLFP